MQEKLCSINETASNLIKLRELTHKLPTFGGLVKTRIPGFVEMETIEGHSFGINLLNQDNISVAKWFMSNGTIFSTHSHEEKEWIIVFEGSITIIYDNETKKLNEGDSCFNDSGVSHGATCDEDCWFLAITIPSSIDWPK